MQTYTFDAEIKQPSDYPTAGYVDIPFDVEETFGKKRVKILAHIDGIPYRGSLVRYAGQSHMLLILKEIREQLGKNHGDTVHIELQEDTTPRTMEVPESLQAAFGAHPAAKAFFESLSYTNQKEYTRWITSAKRETTKASRLAKTVEKLLAGKKNPGEK